MAETERAVGNEIERLAKLLAERDVYEGYDKPTRASMIESAMPRRLREVRVILQAMREPTPDMCHVAMMTAVRENKGIEYAPHQGWVAMIDYILSPPQAVKG